MPSPRLLGFALLAVVLPGTATADEPAQPPASPATTAPEETVIIVDLRKDDAADRTRTRTALAKALGGIHGVRATDDPGLAAAAAGERGPSTAPDPDAILAEARNAYGRLDCAASGAAARGAVTALAAAQAGGHDVTKQLTQAYVYQLLCADRFRDIDAATAAARRLRRLGWSEKPPTGIDLALWNNYPEIDASSNVMMARITLDTDPGGGEVWLDHRRVGLAPVTVFTSEGSHVIAGATDTHRGASSITIDSSDSKHLLALAAPAADSWGSVRQVVAGWRTGQEATPKSLGSLIDQAGVRVALLLTKPGRIEVWGVGKKGRPATMLGAAANAMRAAAIINERVGAWNGGPGIDPTRDLLREDPRTRGDKLKEKPRWWVYATIIGAVAVGTALVVANEVADDRQKIDVVFP